MKKLFDEIPYLEGESLILKKITENDREALHELSHSNTVKSVVKIELTLAFFPPMEYTLRRRRTCFLEFFSGRIRQNSVDWRSFMIIGSICI